MIQRLIVEGDDAWVLAELCKKHKLLPPKGYETKKKFEDFVLPANGISNVPRVLDAALKEPGLTNLGIIVDANDVGPRDRWETIREKFSRHFSKEVLRAAALSAEGIVLRQDGRPTVGFWVMPDNDDKGYLEHFLGKLVVPENETWLHANERVEHLRDQPFCLFSENKKQKALLRTYLAWQSEPGLPFGTAMKKSYFDHNRPAALPFIEWMRQVFHY